MRVITEALRAANLAPTESLGLIETHGTGTGLGDAIEIAALKRALAQSMPAAATTARCAIGAVKANIGHLEVASGAAGLLKTVLAVENGKVPPLANFRRLHPAISLEGTGLFVPTAVTAWPVKQGPRLAAVSSFGMGGTNVHVIIQQYTPPAAAAALRRCGV